MPRLFISHSGRDNVEAIAFQSWLANNGWAREDVFVDLHSIGAGERWREKLRKANASCEAVILLASPEALASVECQKELELAEALGKEVILAILRDLTKDDPRLTRYSDRQFVDLTAEPKERLEPFEHEGRLHRVEFSAQALAAIKARLADLGIAPGSFTWPRKSDANPEPYPGLAAFGEDDAGIFFGRDSDILRALTELRLVRRRRTPRMFVIEAASGAGKSSFLRAGLWPRLQRDPDFAPLAILRPAQGIITGPDGLGRRISPFFERHGRLKAPGTINAVLTSPNHSDGVTALHNLLAEATELATVARRAANQEARPPAVLLAIDQGEELFGAENEGESRSFLAMLAQVLQEPPEDTDPYVLVTIRADSAESLLHRVAELGLEAPKPVYLPPLSPVAYRDVIFKPAEVYNAKVRRLDVEPMLADALVADASGADALPLLAFTLSRLFADYGAEGKLTLARYREMGGIDGSISRTLTDVLVRSGTQGTPKMLRRLIVPRLATWDPDANQRKGAAKRIVASIASAIGGDKADLEPLAKSLIAARLLTRTRDTLEVAHEALLRQQPISDWLEDNREFLVWRDRLARERMSYESNHRGLLFGRELQLARHWVRSREPQDIADADREYIQLSESEDEQRRAEAEALVIERQRAELEASQARVEAAVETARSAQTALQMLEAKQRHARRTLGGVAAVIVLAASLGGVIWWASELGREAVEARDAELREQSKRLTAIASREIEKEQDHVTGLLLALEALQEGDANDATTRGPDKWAPAERHLDAARRGRRELSLLKGHTDSLTSVVVTPDGKRFVTGAHDDTARIWDAATGAELAVLKGHGNSVRGVAVTPDGARIITASDDDTIRVWDARTGAEMRVITGHGDSVRSVTVTADGTQIISGSDDKTVRIWDAITFAELTVLKGHASSVRSVAVTTDGTRIVTGSDDQTARIWDVKSGETLMILKGHADMIRGVALSPDGTRVVTASEDHSARVWDAGTGELLRELRGHTGAVRAVTVAPDGSTIVTSSDDHTVRVWDASTFVELSVLRGHARGVASAAVSPDGSLIVTGSDDDTVRTWSAKARAELLTLNGHTNWVRSITATLDGTRVITGSHDKTVRVWDTRTGKQLAQLPAHQGLILSVAVTHDGRKIVTGSIDQTARVWNAATGEELAVLRGHTGWVRSVATLPDGIHVVTGSHDRTARIWDTTTGATVFELKGHTDLIRAVAVTPDGSRVVTGSDDQTARVWDAKSGALLHILSGHEDTIWSVAVTPDGTRIVTGSADRTARIWDARTGVEVRVLAGHSGWITSIAVTADSARIVTGASDHSARVWDSRSGDELTVLKGHTDKIWGVAVSQDGARTLIATASADKTARLWELLPSGQLLVEQSRQIAPRCLTREQRKRYDLPPTPPEWCQRLQKWPYDAITVAEHHFLEKRFPQAIEAFQLAMAIDANSSARLKPRMAAAHEALAWGALKQGRLEESLVAVEKAMGLAPQDANIRDTRGQIYLERGDIEEALADFNRAIAGGYNRPSSHYGRGRCFELKGNTLAAISDYRKAVEVKPKSEDEITFHEKARGRLDALGVTDQSENAQRQ